MAVTKSTDLFQPQIVAPIISGAIEKSTEILELFNVINIENLTEGAEYVVSKYGTIGRAEDVAEGEPIPVEKLTHTKTSYVAKKVGKGVDITDEAQKRGIGDPILEGATQIGVSVNNKKVDDAFDCIYRGVKQSKDFKTILNYQGVVQMLGILNDKKTKEKVLVVSPLQYNQLLLDPNFIDKSKYGGDVMFTGEIGMIAGCRVVKHDGVVIGTTENIVNYPKLKEDFYGTLLLAIPNDELKKIPTEHPLTIIVEREIFYEVERNAKNQFTSMYASSNYGMYVSNESRIVIGNFKKE